MSNACDIEHPETRTIACALRVLDAGQSVMRARHRGRIEWIADVGEVCLPAIAAPGYRGRAAHNARRTGAGMNVG